MAEILVGFLSLGFLLLVLVAAGYGTIIEADELH